MESDLGTELPLSKVTLFARLELELVAGVV